MQLAVKSLDERGRVGGYLVVWGNRQQPDLHGEYFTPQTDFALDWFPVRPVLYHHGLNNALKSALVGTLDRLRVDELGIWAEAQLHLEQPHVAAVLRMIDEGALAWSSGSLPHLVERAADGRILRWPLIEGSLTPNPAEPRHTDVQRLESAYKALGLDARWLMPPQPASPITGETQPMQENTLPPTSPAPLKRLPQNPADAHKAGLPRVEVTSPYDALSVEDMLHGYMLLSGTKHFQGMSQPYANALAYKVQRANLMAAKTGDELSHSTQATYGAEWVPELWSAQVWRRARAENVVLPLFQSVEMPSTPFDLPVEGVDPTVYYVGETTDEAQLTFGAGNPIPLSKIGSGKVTLNAKKLALRVGFPTELSEDAIVPLLSLYREQAVRAILDSIDHVLLNGDTAAANNVNLDGDTPASNARYRAFDGVRKAALVNAHDANGALTLEKLRSARFKLPLGYAARPQDLAWIVDKAKKLCFRAA